MRGDAYTLHTYLLGSSSGARRCPNFPDLNLYIWKQCLPVLLSIRTWDSFKMITYSRRHSSHQATEDNNRASNAI